MVIYKFLLHMQTSVAVRFRTLSVSPFLQLYTTLRFFHIFKPRAQAWFNKSVQIKLCEPIIGKYLRLLSTCVQQKTNCLQRSEFLSVAKTCYSEYSSNTKSMTENRYLTGYAKLGTSSCKKCKQKIDKGALRIAKLVSNPFSEDAGDMKQWFHPACIFETFVRARATTKKIEDTEDVEGFSDLQQEDKDLILQLIKGRKEVMETFALS